MKTWTFQIACAAALTAMAGCSRDPIAASRKYLDRGDGYFQTADYKAAAIEYRNAAKIAPQSGTPHLKLGEVAMRSGDLETAIDEYLRAASLDPQNAAAQVRAASAYLMTGRFH